MPLWFPKMPPRQWDPPIESPCYTQRSGNGNWVPESKTVGPEEWRRKHLKMTPQYLVLRTWGLWFFSHKRKPRIGVGGNEEFSSCLFWVRWSEALPARMELWRDQACGFEFRRHGWQLQPENEHNCPGPGGEQEEQSWVGPGRPGLGIVVGRGLHFCCTPPSAVCVSHQACLI